MKKFLSVLLAIILIVSVFSGCKEVNPPETQGKEDPSEMITPKAMASFGNSPISGIETAEPADLKVVGTSEIKTVSVLVGDNDGSYTTRTLKGYGAEMSFTLEGVTPNKVAMLDIEEIHQRDDGAIAYTVYVNGVEMFDRSYEVCADGPNHAFFDIPADVVGSEGKLTIRLVNKTDNEVRFRQVWAISDPEAMAQEQGIAKKMDVVLMINAQPRELNLDYLKSLVDSYKCAGMYNIGLCWEIQYMQWGKETTEEWLNNVFLASVYTGAPLYLGINSWWGGTPSGVDGQGGYWQDVAYQQITYDRNNTDGRGQWQLSSPNEFSDTPWLSMNNDYYNQVRVQRIKETVEFIQLRTAELAAAGRNLPAIHLYTENEPYYWPIYWQEQKFENTPHGVGDFSHWVIEAAAADGVTLDPTDGLTKEEEFWMYRNLHTYISEVGKAMSDGLGYNHIVVKDGEITYPTEQIVNDSYSHTPIHSIYPNWDENQKSWENHVLDSIHFGGEWSIYQDDNIVRGLDYLIAYGSFSNINAERLGFPGGYAGTDFRVLSQCYTYGLEGVIIYNVLLDSDQQNVIDESSVGGTLLQNRLYSTDAIFKSDFSKRTGYSIGNTLIDIQGLRWDGSAVIPNNIDGGSLTYRIANTGDYTDGLRLAATGSFAGEGGRFEILAGTSLDDLKSVGVYPAGEGSVHIDPSYYAGGSEIYIKARVYGEDMAASELAGLSITSVGIYRPGGKSGRTDGTLYTYDQNRIRCQIIAARADAERMINRYVEECGGQLTTQTQKDHFKAAYELYAQGRYGEAFSSISQSISQLLPATFTVAGHGQLGTYPLEVSVDSSAKVTVKLKEVTDTSILFSMSSSSNAKVTVSLLADDGSWGMTQTENGDWLISAGDTPVQDGKASFTVELKERISKEYAKEFGARLIYASGSNIAVQSQDPAATDYCQSTDFVVSSEVTVSRGADGTQPAECSILDLRAGDYVQIKLNDAGQVVEIVASYGQITGKVVAVEQVNLEAMTNPFVTVELSNGTTKRLEIGYDTQLTFTGATGALGKLVFVDDVGLEIGQTISITYCPYEVNGRVRALKITD